MSIQKYVVMNPDDQKESEKKREDKSKDKKRQLLGLEPVETQHELTLKDRSYKYIVRVGVLPLKDEFDQTEAEIFFVAYELEGIANRVDRPLTFVFNGGPGSSSVWLHMGALGPQRVCMEKEGWMPRPPIG